MLCFLITQILSIRKYIRIHYQLKQKHRKYVSKNIDLIKFQQNWFMLQFCLFIYFKILFYIIWTYGVVALPLLVFFLN